MSSTSQIIINNQVTTAQGTTSKAIELLGPTSKQTLGNLSITPKDLIGKIDFNDSLTKENIVTVEYINGKYITKTRIENNVSIYKDDLKTIPILLEVIDQSVMYGSSIRLDSFDNDTQTKIAICFMIYNGYIRIINNEYWFTPHIEVLFNTSWWGKLFTIAKIKTRDAVNQDIALSNQPIKNLEMILDAGLISVNEFKTIQPEKGMDILWALGIYFFEKIIRNYQTQDIPETPFTDTIMDIDINPGKYIKSLDAKTFFLTQLRIYLGLQPTSIFFGGGYYSIFKQQIHKKVTDINKRIILEELRFFTNNMNMLYSGGNNQLNSSKDSGTEPFAILDVIYSDVDNGPTTDVHLTIVLQINTFNISDTFALPISSRIE